MSKIDDNALHAACMAAAPLGFVSTSQIRKAIEAYEAAKVWQGDEKTLQWCLKATPTFDVEAMQYAKDQCRGLMMAEFVEVAVKQYCSSLELRNSKQTSREDTSKNQDTEVQLTIGKYELQRRSDDRIWITIKNDGEGGAFCETELEKVVAAFYEEHF